MGPGREDGKGSRGERAYPFLALKRHLFLLCFTGMIFRVPVALLDLLRSAFFWFPFQLLRLLTAFLSTE